MKAVISNRIYLETTQEYKEFLEWQRSQNIRCPVLHFQKSIDAVKELFDAAKNIDENLK